MIELRQVSKSFGEVNAIRQVNLELADGESMALLGPSGSGKTTLLRLIAGLEYPDAGEITIQNRLVSRPGWVQEPHLRSLGFVFQTPALWPHLSVAQNIAFGLQGLPRQVAGQRLEQLLKGFRLDDLAKRYPAQLSGGEARRVSLARALAPRPACLLLDEPLIYLDSALKNEILAYILNHIKQTGASLLYVTHDEKEALLACQRILHIDNGSIFVPEPFQKPGGRKE